jgi:hypothetical protein
LKAARQLLQPFLNEKRTLPYNGTKDKDLEDMIQFIDRNMTDGLDVAHNQLAVSFAAIHTVSNAVSIIYASEMTLP